MKKKINNILFCGTGGQGVLAAAEICSLAAVYSGWHVKKSEVHGMAQRGGSVESHVRFGQTVSSALIPYGAADILVPFHIDEHNRLKDFLKPGGRDLIGDLIKALAELQDRRYVNIYLLGALSRHLDLDKSVWLRAIDEVLANKNIKQNKEVFFKARGEAYDLE
jgi:indolepyruvate ferredoxin oxidoreductase, beta subunit